MKNWEEILALKNNQDVTPPSEDTPIPFFKMEFHNSDIIAVVEVMSRRNNWTKGKELPELADRLTQFGYYDAQFCNSGTTALWLVLSYLDNVSFVICPNYTYRATVDSIILAGKTPVLVDVDDSGYMDLNQVEEILSNYKLGKNFAVMSANLFGVNHNAKREKLRYLCDKHNIVMVEDLCQSFGVKLYGHIGCLSFVQNKVLAAGEAGSIIYNNNSIYNKKEVSTRIINMIDHGGTEVRIGNNFRLSSINAAILISQLNRFDSIRYERRKLAEAYTNGLEGIESITQLNSYNEKDNIFSMYPILIKEGYLELSKYLVSKGIGNARYPCFSSIIKDQMLYIKTDNPIARYLEDSLLLLPFYTGEPWIAKRVTRLIQEYYKHYDC